jgi:hypothetical protein
VDTTKKIKEKQKDVSKPIKVKRTDSEEKKLMKLQSETAPKEKKLSKQVKKTDSEDEKMEVEKEDTKLKAQKIKKLQEPSKLKELAKEKSIIESSINKKKQKDDMEVDKENSDEEEKLGPPSISELSKSHQGKRRADSKSQRGHDSKRRKTEKGEKSVGLEKRKFKHIEWQYGRHCSRDLWIGKKVKVKAHTKNKDDPVTFHFGKITDIKPNDQGEKVMFQIEWSGDKKGTEWINLNNNKIYIFGQILFLKHPHDKDQIELIKDIYGWKEKETKAIPLPVIELINANDKEKRITPYEDPNEKIPIQYFNVDKAKKFKQFVLYDYREFKDEYFEYLKTYVKNGDRLHSEIMKYKKHYSQWIDKHSKIDIDMSESLQPYTAKIVRVYKKERNCGKALILR